MKPVLHDLFPYNPDHGVYFDCHNLSEKRPTFQELLSSLEFVKEVIVLEYKKGPHKPKYIIGSVKKGVSVCDIDLGIYDQIRYRPVMVLSPLDHQGLWIELGEEEEQMKLF